MPSDVDLFGVESVICRFVVAQPFLNLSGGDQSESSYILLDNLHPNTGHGTQSLYPNQRTAAATNIEHLEIFSTRKCSAVPVKRRYFLVEKHSTFP